MAIRSLRRRRRPAPPPPREGILFLGPRPPARSGVATYDDAVLEGLQRVAPTLEIKPIWPVEPGHEARVAQSRLAVYQMGNSVEHHLEIFRLLWRHPGLVVLHDLAVDGFVHGLEAEGDALASATVRREAALAAASITSADILGSEPLRMPYIAAIVRRARGIIVHSPFGRRYLEELGCRTPVFVVPHPPVESATSLRRAAGRARSLRERMASRGARTLVVAPGELNRAKGLDELIAASAALPGDTHVVIAGRNPAYDVRATASAAGLADRVTVVLDASDEEFLAWIVAADIVVELRDPHRGEVSGSLTRAMQAGRASIVSATGSYLDLPDDAVVRIAPGPPDVAELTDRIRTLRDDEVLRERIGATAAAHMAELERSEATAAGYVEAIVATLALVEDPIAGPMARWAKALADIGVTQEHLDAGYGLSYARALGTFKPS